MEPQFTRGRLCRALVIAFLALAAPCIAQNRPAVRPAPASTASNPTDTDDSIRGYAQDLPLSKAVDDFNSRAFFNSTGKTQPPLTREEVIAALRAINVDTKMAQRERETFTRIADTGIAPKGSFLRFIPKLVAVHGYDIDVWWIDLQIELDKYPTDQADVPMYMHRIRTAYVSAHPHPGSLPE